MASTARIATTAGNSYDVRGAAAEGSFFPSCVEEHDNEGEKNHDGAGWVDDDFQCGGEKLRSQQKVEDSQGCHHHNQREGAVDGMGLQQEVNGSCQAEYGKDDKQDQVHRTVAFWRVPSRKARQIKGRRQGAGN